MRYATPNRNRPIRLEGQPHRRRVNAQATTPNLSDPQWLEAMACFKTLWDLAQKLDSLLAAQASSQHGRAPKHSAFETLLFEVAAWQLGTYRAVGRTLADPLVWDRLRSAVEAAFPDDPRMRLSAEPITRAQHAYSRAKLSNDMIEVMNNMVTEAAITAVQSMRMLVPGLKPSPFLDKRSFVSADGTWFPTKTEPAQGVTRKEAPMAHRLVTVLARNPHHQERVVLSARARPFRSNRQPPGEAAMVAHTVLWLVERFPNLRAGLRGVVCDPMPSMDSDRLLEAGIIPVSKAQRGDHRFAQVLELRNECEFVNHQMKRKLGRSYGSRHIGIKAIAFQTHVLIEALVAHHNRTRTLDTTEWFGLHQLPID